jgi:hypothetical protein
LVSKKNKKRNDFRNSKKQKQKEKGKKRKGATRAFELSECDKRNETEGSASHLNRTRWMGKGGEDSSSYSIYEYSSRGDVRG